MDDLPKDIKENTIKNDKKTRAEEYLDPETKKFKKGNPGGGRPKGSVSIKTEIIKRLENNPEELKAIIEYFIKENRELMWQMLEGRPQQQVGIDAQIEEKQIRELVLTTRKILELNVSKPKDNRVGQEQIQERQGESIPPDTGAE